MLTARLANGRNITLLSLEKTVIDKLRKEKFFCPTCNNEVIIKAGEKVRPHFAHVINISCPTNRNYGEGPYHLEGKLLLYQWLKSQQLDPLLETYLPEINQRPDIFLEINEKKIAIEFQCAKVSQIEINIRNSGYQQAEITPIWILGANQLPKRRNNFYTLTDFLLQFTHRFSTQHPPLLLFFCPHQKSFIRLSDFYLINSQKSVAFYSSKLMTETSFPQLFTKQSFNSGQLFSIWLKEKRKFRLSRHHVLGRELAWRKQLYEQGMHVEQLPSIVFLPISSQYMMKIPLAHWQSKIIIEFLYPLKINDTFKSTAIIPLLHFAIKNKYLKLTHMVIDEYLTLLEECRIIKRLSQDMYVKCKQVEFFHHIEDALRADAELIRLFMYNRKYGNHNHKKIIGGNSIDRNDEGIT